MRYNTIRRRRRGRRLLIEGVPQPQIFFIFFLFYHNFLVFSRQKHQKTPLFCAALPRKFAKNPIKTWGCRGVCRLDFPIKFCQFRQISCDRGDWFRGNITRSSFSDSFHLSGEFNSQRIQA